MEINYSSLDHLPFGYARKAVHRLRLMGYTNITAYMVYTVRQNKPSTYKKEILSVLLGIAVNTYQFYKFRNEP